MMLLNSNARAGVQIPNSNEQPRDRTLLLIEQAQSWTRFVLERARMRPETVYRKALESVAFSLQHRARAFAVPSKLAGTSRHQEALRSLHDLNPMLGHRLDYQTGEDRIVVSFSDLTLGHVQDKHVPWLRPLLEHGATLHLLAVTGAEREDGYLGGNVAFARLSAAQERMQHISGDGAALAVELAEDVYLWRDRQGRAQTNVAHVERHSPTGIGWGYAGSGPADLALSILRRFTDPPTADRLYQEFKHDVIAALPHEGGLIRAAFIVSWLYAHGA